MTHRILAVPAAVAVLLLGGGALAAPAYATDVFTPGSPNGIDSYFPQDGNGGYRVTQYDLTLRLDPETTDVNGTMVISATATQNLSRFNLDFSDLGTVTASVNGRDAATEFSGEHEMTVIPERASAPGAPSAPRSPIRSTSSRRHRSAVSVRYPVGCAVPAAATRRAESPMVPRTGIPPTTLR